MNYLLAACFVLVTLSTVAANASVAYALYRIARGENALSMSEILERVFKRTKYRPIRMGVR